MIAPVIPVLTVHYLESIMQRSRNAGALTAAYVMLRLPNEVGDLFEEWIHYHYPNQAKHVLNRLKDMRHGKTYHSEFGERMRGTGIFADLIAKRFRKAYDKLAFSELPELDCESFRHPRTAQLSLF